MALPITVGVPPLHIVWPAVLMAPVVNAERIVTAPETFEVVVYPDELLVNTQ